MQGANLIGSLPSSICAFASIQVFDVRFNSLTGAIPLCIGAAWKSLISFDVHDNHFEGGLLPPLPFQNLGSCVIFYHISGGTNSFTCPWPAGAVQHCYNATGGRTEVPVTEADCTSPCTGASANLAVDQCLAWLKFYNDTNGPNWEVCSEFETDPCSCQGDGGTDPVCNNDGTTILQM